jgi:hypothetical protein
MWTAVISVPGYSPMSATWSEHDQHDDQILHAAHEALRLMRKSGAQFGVIDLFQNTDEHVACQRDGTGVFPRGRDHLGS